MTKRTTDWVTYNDEQYVLLGDTTRQLPMLDRYGFKPVPIVDGDSKGYIAKYAVVDESFHLVWLLIYDADLQYPEIGGVKPKVPYIVALYENLSVPMKIDGSVVIGKDGVDYGKGLSVEAYMPDDFQRVLKLVLRNGEIQSVEDISQQAAAIRDEYAQIEEERRNLPNFPTLWKFDERQELKARSRALIYGVDAEGNFPN
jgi:hypothetical protein